LPRFIEQPSQVLLEPQLLTFNAPGGLDEGHFEKSVALDEPTDDGSSVEAVLPQDDEEEEDDGT
jgi:hypothetical protein